MSKLEQIKALKKGNGIQSLLDSANKIFCNPIVMFDTNYDLISYTDIASDDPIWNELITNRTFSMKTQRFFEQECFVEDVANADKIVIMKSNKLKYDRILGNIFNSENIKVANIVMVESCASFADEDPIAFEKLADKITHEIKHDEYYTSFGRAYHESLINKLLDQTIVDPGIYASHVQILFEGFKDYLYLAVVDVSQSCINQDRLVYFKDLFESKYRSSKFAVHFDYLVMIMSSKYNKFYRKRFFNKHYSLLDQNDLFIGVSSCFENLFELHKYYNEAVSSLKDRMNSGNDQRVFLYEER